jgi:hypothetical protein
MDPVTIDEVEAHFTVDEIRHLTIAEIEAKVRAAQAAGAEGEG